MLDLLSQILYSGRGAGSPRPMVHFENAAPHRSVSLKIVSRVVNSDTLSNHLMALTSVPVASFCSVI
jgi:hypothetical protein